MIRLTVWLAAANAAQLLLAFGQTVLLTRWLGLESFGHVGYLLSLVTLADTVAQGGLERIVVREIAARPGRDGALLAAALKARFALAAAAGLLLFPFAGRWGALMLAATLGQTGTAVLQARRLRGPQVAAGLGGSLLSFGAVLAGMAWIAPSVRAAMAVLALGGLARAAYQLLLAHRFLARPVRVLRGAARRDERPAALLRASWPLWLNALVVAGYYRLDVILLRWLLEPAAGVAQIGWYRVAFTLTEGGSVVLGALAVSAFPLFSSHQASSPALLRPTFRRALRWAAGLGGIAVAATWLLGGPVVRLLYRSEMWPGAAALPWLAPVLLLGLLNSLHALALTAMHRTRAVLAVSAAQLAFNAAANLAAIPLFGYRGAAAVTAATEAVGLVLFAWRTRAAFAAGRRGRGD